MTVKRTHSELVPGWATGVQARIGRWLRAGLGNRWVVAVSGGSDSVGLLRLLHASARRLGLELTIAHLNHGVRGDEARADAEFVAELARSLDLPFEEGSWKPERAAHFETDARRARYAWLTAVASVRGASVVAVGHTSDDQAETILHRILRGTGPRGLAGMPARRRLNDAAWLVRPLLGVGRSDVQSYLKSIGQPYRLDASNVDVSRTRARIRHDLLPKLAQEYNPAIAAALVRLGRLTGACYRALHEHVNRLEAAATISRSIEEVALDRELVAVLPPALRAELLRAVWRTQGWPEGAMNTRRWCQLACWVKRPEGERISMGAGVDAEAVAGAIRLHRTEVTAAVPTQGGGRVAFDCPGSALWGCGRVVLSLDPSGPCQERIDVDALVPSFSVGPPEPGERFEPLGMNGHGMHLGHFLRTRHVPRAERASTPIMRDAHGIIWVVGHRLAHRVRLTDRTQRVGYLRWESLPETS